MLTTGDLERTAEHGTWEEIGTTYTCDSRGRLLFGVLQSRYRTRFQTNSMPTTTNRVLHKTGGGPRIVVSTAAFHARARGSLPGLGDLKETENVSSPSTCESQYCGEPP